MKPRWLYWWLFIVVASQGRFISLVMSDSLRFSDSQVGLVLGLGVVASMISLPIASRQADLIGCLTVESRLVAGHFVAFGLLGLVGFIQDDIARLIFAIISRFVAFAFMAPSGPVLDAYTLKMIDDKTLYGKERLWGAISWAFASILMGFGMDWFDSPLYVSLVFLVVGTVLFYAFLHRMPDERKRPGAGLDLKSGPRSPSLLTLWWGRPTVAVFFYVALVMGADTSFVENLLFLFMRQDLKASYTLCGVSVVITVVFEIPLFFAGHRLLSNVGVLKLLLIGMFCYVSRVVCYTLIDVPWTVLLIEPFHGLTFATIQMAAVAFVHRNCPKDRVAEGQGTYTLVRSTGQLLGTTIGSWVLETFGSKVMYRLSAAIVTVSALLLFAVFKRYERADILRNEALLSEYDPDVSSNELSVSVTDEDVELSPFAALSTSDDYVHAEDSDVQAGSA